MSSSNTMSSKSINRKKDEFVDVASQVNPFFKDEGIPLNFKGYIRTLNEYVRCDEYDLETLDKLTCDLNLWGLYFGELESVVENLKLRYENKELYLKAFANTPKTEKELNLNKYKLNKTKLFLKHLKIQKNLFSRLHYHCLKMYNEACEHYVYRY